MSQVWLAALAILGGFAGLVWRADRFVAGSAALVAPLLWLTARCKKAHLGPEEEDVGIHNYTTPHATIWFLIGLAALLASSEMLAWSARHLALGSIIGSNVFNILAVMSVPGIIATTQMEDAVFSRDYLALLAIILMLVAAIAARLGALLLASHIAYYRLLFSPLKRRSTGILYNHRNHRIHNSDRP